VSLIVTLREEARLPVGVIQWYLRAVHQLTLSKGAIVAACRRVAERGRAAVAALREQIRGSPVVPADETGWRQNGGNGYVGTFCTPTTRCFTRGPREGQMVDAVLGETFAGVLCTDFYVGDQHYPGRIQKCWAHLLRDIHELVAAHPDQPDVAIWAAGVRAIYDRAVTWAADATAAQTRPILRERARDRFEAELIALCQAPPSEAPQAVLCARIVRYRADLFTFVADPAVPPTNNAAERALRPLVVARKISGGTRSERGSATRMVLQSLVATWELRGLDPLAEFLTLLRAPRPTLEIAPV
jgi:hypothetical protein